MLIASYIETLLFFLRSAQGEDIKQFLTWLAHPVSEYVNENANNLHRLITRNSGEHPKHYCLLHG